MAMFNPPKRRKIKTSGFLVKLSLQGKEDVVAALSQELLVNSANVLQHGFSPRPKTVTAERLDGVIVILDLLLVLMAKLVKSRVWELVSFMYT